MQLLEAGDIALSEIIPFAIVVFGLTKAGKTTLCHYLSNHTLQGYSDGQSSEKKERKFKLTIDKQKSEGIIGDTKNSQT